MLQNREGRIIAVSSVSGITGNRGQVNYSASKAGIIGAVKALARETAKRNITVNCIAPGVIMTDMMSGFDEEALKELKAETPLGRLGAVGDIAAAALFLASDSASFITGQTLGVNGGFVIY